MTDSNCKEKLNYYLPLESNKIWAETHKVLRGTSVIKIKANSQKPQEPGLLWPGMMRQLEKLRNLNRWGIS